MRNENEQNRKKNAQRTEKLIENIEYFSLGEILSFAFDLCKWVEKK